MSADTSTADPTSVRNPGGRATFDPVLAAAGSGRHPAGSLECAFGFVQARTATRARG